MEANNAVLGAVKTIAQKAKHVSATELLFKTILTSKLKCAFVQNI